MTTAAWVMIGVCVAGNLFTVAWWLVRRPIGRLDRIEAAVFGETGVNMRLHRYVTTEAFEQRMGKIDDHLRGVSEEGQQREDRILKAIANQNTVMISEVRELKADVREQMSEVKTDVRNQTRRVDDLIAKSGGGR